MRKVFRETKQEPAFYSTKQLDYPAHIHEDIELVFVKRGFSIAYCDGRAYRVEEGQFFLVFPNQVHHYIDSSNGDYILLVLKPTMLPNQYELFLKGYPLQATTAADANTVALLTMALEEFERDGFSTVIEAYLTAFFEKLITFYSIEKGTVSSDTVLRILQYCTEHYKEDISIASVAAELELSKSTVSHIFSTRLGIGFCDHINTLRLNNAVQLLKNKTYSVTEVSDMAGFATIRTFNRVFRKQYGISPTAFRKQSDG